MHMQMSFTWPFLVIPVFFRTGHPCSGGYHLERSGMPLHDAVWINCKKGQTTENQRAGVKYNNNNNNDLLEKDGQRTAYTRINGLAFKASSVRIDCY